jgi:hypothetical protein
MFKVEEKEKELKVILEEMEEIKQQLIEDTVEFVEKWYEETTKKYITKYPDISLNLSSQEFSDFKGRIRKLVSESRKIVENALSQKGIWWHQQPDLHAATSLYEQLGNQEVGNKYPEVLDNSIRTALGELGGILEEFGFQITTNPVYQTYKEFWYLNKEEKIVSPFFPHLFDWSTKMKETLKEYNRLFQQGLSKLQEIQMIKDEEKRKQVMNLWDSTP